MCGKGRGRKHTRGSSYSVSGRIWGKVDIRLLNNYTKDALMTDKYFSFFLYRWTFFSLPTHRKIFSVVLYLNFSSIFTATAVKTEQEKRGDLHKTCEWSPWYHITGTFCWLNIRHQSFLTHPPSNLSHEDGVHFRMGAQVLRQCLSLLPGQAKLIQHHTAYVNG